MKDTRLVRVAGNALLSKGMDGDLDSSRGSCYHRRVK